MTAAEGWWMERGRRGLVLWAVWAVVASTSGLLLPGWVCFAYFKTSGLVALIALAGGIGLLIAGPQWLVLRSYLGVGWKWLPATIGGLLLGAIAAATAGLVFGFFLAGVVASASVALGMGYASIPSPLFLSIMGTPAGLTLGLLQWYLLGERHRTMWWVVASAVGGASAVHALIHFTGGCGDLAAWMIAGLVGGLFYGLVTGAVLAWKGRGETSPGISEARVAQ